MDEFPSEGLIYWPRPKVGRFERGQAWIVETEHRASDRDHYWVRAGAKVVRPWEAVVVPGTDDIVSLRRTLAHGSFPLYPEPAGMALIARPDHDDLWLAPFDAQKHDQHGFAHRFAQRFAKQLCIDPKAFFTLEINGLERRLIDGSAHTAEPAGAFIIQTDDELVAGATRRLKRWDKAAFDALGITRAVLEAHAAQLSRAAGGDEIGQDAARDEALAALLATDTLAAENTRNLAETLVRHPAIAADIDARAEAGAEARRAELESDFATRRAELEAAASAAFAQEEVCLAALRGERAEIERAIATLEPEFARAVERQLAGGVPRLAEHLLTRVLLGAGGGVGHAIATVPVPAVACSPPATPLATVKALRSAVAARAVHDGIDPLLAVIAAGLLLGRRGLLLAGSNAAALATAVATSLAGPNHYRVPVSPTIFAVSDLLALPVDVAGQTMSLGAALTAAAARDETVALVLQGGNRAPLEGAFADLLEAVSPGGAAYQTWRDSSGHSSVARLDGRLLLIATLGEGPTTFPVPRALAMRVPLLDADRTLLDTNYAPPTEAPAPTMLAATLFDELAVLASPRETIDRWRAVAADLERPAVLSRYIAIAEAVLPRTHAIPESLAALTVGREGIDVSAAAALGVTWVDRFDPDAQSRRLSRLIEKGFRG